jgi:hypothetical protein
MSLCVLLGKHKTSLKPGPGHMSNYDVGSSRRVLPTLHSRTPPPPSFTNSTKQNNGNQLRLFEPHRLPHRPRHRGGTARTRRYYRRHRACGRGGGVAAAFTIGTSAGKGEGEGGGAGEEWYVALIRGKGGGSECGGNYDERLTTRVWRAFVMLPSSLSPSDPVGLRSWVG